jgi:type IV secretion system protein TrbG
VRYQTSLLVILAVAALAGCATAPLPQPEPIAAPAVSAPEPEVQELPAPKDLPIMRPENPPDDPIKVVHRANQRALMSPTDERFNEAMLVYPYVPAALYRVDTAIHQPTDIVLPPGEVFSGAKGLDPKFWVLERRDVGEGEGVQTHLILLARHPNRHGGLRIFTHKSVYYLSVFSHDDKSMIAVTWQHPPEPQRFRSLSSAGKYGVGYGLSGGDDLPWRPTYVFDNGRQVTILFPRERLVTEAPVFLVLSSTGAQQMVNYQVTSRSYVIDRLFNQGELRVDVGKEGVIRVVKTSKYRQIICPGAPECAVIQSIPESVGGSCGAQ